MLKKENPTFLLLRDCHNVFLVVETYYVKGKYMTEVCRVKSLSFQQWFWAIRPKTLTTAIVPFLVGTFLAMAQGHTIQWTLLVFSWLSALCIQIGTNITNDAYDYKKGTDNAAVLGPQRATREGLLSGTLTFRSVLNVGLGFFVAALFFGLPLMSHGGLPVVLILTFSVLSGFLYTGGPYPLAYHGLGDVFVMLFYGIVATNAAYWLQVGKIEWDSLLLSLQIGCLCTSMIGINNLRDVFDDAKTNKRTLPVRYGVLFGKIEITALLLLPLLLNLLWPWSLACWLPLLSAPFALKILNGIWTQEPSREYNHFLALSGANMLIFCTFQVIGFALA